ncbi:hypothetical protein LRS06_18920 [Hymenobacter sp. J193]|uniref:hypothetical protein n=1 Tax=Hymenobacter sp. J193 TaxID=2898429 RepID=UPI0021507A07|nr:hypothetical protein [Hymenobacter sp. J193]MCR5889804.1 hypothetical protein [Hymenobacter sp. J193]
MRTFSIIVALLSGLSGLLTACSSSPNPAEQVTAAEQRVLASHDSLMARMDQLYSRRQQLQALPAADSAGAGARRRALLAAESAMMSWMHQYRKPADTMAPARQLTYFARQQQRIDSVGLLMNSSLDSAQALLPAAPTAASPSSL